MLLFLLAGGLDCRWEVFVGKREIGDDGCR